MSLYQPFLIGNFRQGLIQYYRPWLLADDAFEEMGDTLIFRGNVIKRGGYSRLDDQSNPTSLPAGPVMGLWKRDRPGIATEDLIAFNLTNAFIFNTATEVFDDISGATVWTGSNSDFFWAMNGFQGFFATNFVDPIRYYLAGTTWTNFTPTVNGAVTLQRALLLFPYRGRLVALSTVEAGISYAQRARWCKLNNPYVTAPVPSGFTSNANNWRDDLIGNGGFIDAPTGDSIVSAGFNKDTLIVAFTNSTWRLTYTNNELQPFIWEQIDSNLGAECTFSAVDFDESVLFISRRGIIAADSNVVKRIDEKVIEEVQQIEIGSSGLKRVQGIRDFDRQLVYWTYGNMQDQPTSPNRVLCFNYVENAWSIFNQSFTTFGKFRQTTDIQWQQINQAWSAYQLQWNSGLTQSGTEIIVSGDVDGNVYKFDDSGTDADTNFGFDIRSKQYNPFMPGAEKCRLKYIDFYLDADPNGEFTLEVYTDDDDSNPVVTKTVSFSAGVSDSAYVRVFINTVGRFHQLRLYLSDAQLADNDIAQSSFILQAMVLWVAPAGRPFNA